MPNSLKTFFNKPQWKHPVTNMLLGVIGSLITAAFLNMAHLIEIRIPKTEMLTSFNAVLNKAAEVINASDKSIVMATDVPAMGVISEEAAFKNYANSLKSAKYREKKADQSLDIVWLKRDDEKVIAETENLSDNDVKKALDASNDLRDKLAGRTVRERTLPALMFFYFWSGETKGGDAGSVVAFNDGMDLNAPVKGFYTNSSDVHTVLKRVLDVLASDSLEKEVLSSYKKISGCASN